MIESDPSWAPFLAKATAKAGISVGEQRTAADVITSGEELVVRLLEPCNARCDLSES